MNALDSLLLKFRELFSIWLIIISSECLTSSPTFSFSIMNSTFLGLAVKKSCRALRSPDSLNSKLIIYLVLLKISDSCFIIAFDLSKLKVSYFASKIISSASFLRLKTILDSSPYHYWSFRLNSSFSKYCYERGEARFRICFIFSTLDLSI